MKRRLAISNEDFDKKYPKDLYSGLHSFHINFITTINRIKKYDSKEFVDSFEKEAFLPGAYWVNRDYKEVFKQWIPLS